MDHLEAVNAMAIERYLLEEMTDEERESFEAHYFSCAECAEDARAAALMRDGAAGGLARVHANPTPIGDRARVSRVRPASASWRWSIALPWAAAAVLAVGVGYQIVDGPVLSRRGADAVPLLPSTLRPASRGPEPAVSPGPGGVVTLAVDLGGARFDAGIRYELRSADGGTITSGTAPTPVAGAPLLLMLPGSMLKTSERYVLSVQSAGTPGLTQETYRFRVQAP